MKIEQLEDLRQEIIKQTSQEDQGLETPEERQIRFLTEDTSIPVDLASDLWALSDKELVIANFTKEDVLRLRNKRKAIELARICKMDPDEFDFSHDLNMRQLDFKGDIKMTRSVGGFERKMQVTQTKNMNIKTTPLEQKRHKGIGRIGRLFGRKPKEVQT
jgi:hypothetical protein